MTLYRNSLTFQNTPGSSLYVLSSRPWLMSTSWLGELPFGYLIQGQLRQPPTLHSGTVSGTLELVELGVWRASVSMIQWGTKAAAQEWVPEALQDRKRSQADTQGTPGLQA